MSADLIPQGEYASLVKRGITEDTCRFWGYSIGEYQDEKVQIAAYKDESGQVVAQKIRTASKDFKFLGDTKEIGLYGQWLWRDKGKKIVITEGEIDALSVSQVQNNKWPVVSVPNGANGAKKAIQKNLEYLEGFEEVIFMFDMDEPGQRAVQECVQLFSPGKAKVAKLALKDANELLKAGRGAEIIDAIWGAKTYRPDGIVCGNELWDIIIKDDVGESFPFPWSGLNEMLKGLRRKELITFTAGSGIGKSQVCREIAHALLKGGKKVGYVALEESVKRTALGLMSIELNKQLHLSMEGVTEDALKQSYLATVGSGSCYLYDHFGSCDSDNLISRIRYLAHGCGCEFVVLDHLSIVVSGIGDGDERRLIDNTMTKLRSLVQETGIGLILVSHLKRPEGNKGHEDGAQVSLAQLRGSAAIAQLSDSVVGLERDQQSSENRNTTTLRVLKNRFSGQTGEAGTLFFSQETGRLTEIGASAASMGF